MSTIVTIASSDIIANSRADLNTNFSNLNTDKIETSVLDTDTALAANSDSKIATQKAVKAYVDAGGNVNASTTARGIVEEATSAEMIAGTAAGATGARLFLNPSLVAETGTDKIVKTKSTGLLDSSIVPSPTRKNGTTSRAGNTASGTQNIAHGIGSIPKFVRIVGRWASAVTGTANASGSDGCYNGTTNSCVWFIQESASETASAGSDDTNGVVLQDNSGSQVAVITFDATNIILTWTRTGGTGSAVMYLLWEATT